MHEAAQTHPLAGWIPWRPTEGQEALEWLPLDGRPFLEPFFEDALRRLRRTTRDRRPVRTAGEALDAPLDGLPAAAPALFIFHVSRCGSTLLAQMLATDPATVVLSEPPLLDHLARHGQAARIPALLRLLGQRQRASERRLVVKLDSWALAYHGALRALFPGVPFALLYRRPGPILESQRRLRGLQAIPGVLPAELFGLEAGDLPALQPGVPAEEVFDRYFERVLARLFAWMAKVAASDPGAFLLDFEAGAEACHRRLLRSLGPDPDPAVLEAARARAALDGKRPGLVFQPPRPAAPAPPPLEAAYTLLDSLRSERRDP
ncbi:MAG: hypothetical protein U0P81_14520 [Holophagaceae bacterium]